MKTRKTAFHTKPRKPLSRTSSLSRGGKGMKKIGKVGLANREANNRLAQILPKECCEIRLPGCLVTWPLHWCHRHKRSWYKGNVEKLSDKKQVVVGCQACHDKIEHNAELTEAVFNELRGNED